MTGVSSALGSFGPFLQVIVDAGVAGVIVVAFMAGWIIPGNVYKKALEETASWRGLYEREREAHQVTREALHVVADRAQASVESARMMTMLTRALRPGRGDDETQAG